MTTNESIVDVAPGLVVGLGASVGGLEAFGTFLAELPAGTGIAFVLVQHLSPDHPSKLTELLAATTPLTVIEATEGLRVQPDHVYIIPPNATLTIDDARLRVETPRRDQYPINAFFRSLAKDQGECAVGVVLSGTGTDGADGITAIRSAGGYVLAQAGPDGAPLSGMPQCAVATGAVDVVLPVTEMPAALVDHLRRLVDLPAAVFPATSPDFLDAICRLIDESVGHDFTGYKQTTLARRVDRRLKFQHIDNTDEYLRLLTDDPAELGMLFRDLLIGVTEFFRDPKAFSALAEHAGEPLVRRETVRVWVPGCATGEEVYSIAMLLLEEAAEHGRRPALQVFGTDISTNALDTARRGRYSEEQMHGVDAARRERWFTREFGHYEVVDALRDLCTFSEHSVIRDPPLSRLNLISCRNLLIYMNESLQGQLVEVFHHSLRGGGFLFLGESELMADQPRYFTPLDHRHRVFVRDDAASSELPRFPLTSAPHVRARAGANPVAIAQRGEFRTIIEELRTTNEELQLSHEELQSINEEMQAVNEELRSVNAELARTNDDLHNLIDSTAIPTLFLDTELRVRRFTPSTRKLFEFGDVSNEPIGALESALDYTLLESDVQETLATLTVVEREVRSMDGITTYLLRARPYRSAAGAIGGVVLTFIDITDRKHREAVQAHLSAIIDSSQDAIIGLGLDGRIMSWNAGSERLTGFQEDEAIGETIALILSPECITETAGVFMRTLRGESVESYPTVCRCKDGTRVHITMTVSSITTDEGPVSGISVIAQDVSARVDAERHRAILMAELDHRVKNTLVAVQSIARQTAQGAESTDDFLTRFEARLIALSRTHNLLLEQHWASASLREMIARELLPYSGEKPRYSITGPDVHLSPKQALALGLGFHELATNAAKHGALASPEGHVEVTWGVDDTGGRGTLWLVWLERGGARVTPPRRRGFGSRLIERGLRSELQADVTLAFEPDGLRFELRASLQEHL